MCALDKAVRLSVSLATTLKKLTCGSLELISSSSEEWPGQTIFVRFLVASYNTCLHVLEKELPADYLKPIYLPGNA